MRNGTARSEAVDFKVLQATADWPRLPAGFPLRFWGSCLARGLPVRHLRCSPSRRGPGCSLPLGFVWLAYLNSFKVGFCFVFLKLKLSQLTHGVLPVSGAELRDLSIACHASAHSISCPPQCPSAVAPAPHRPPPSSPWFVSELRVCDDSSPSVILSYLSSLPCAALFRSLNSTGVRSHDCLSLI